AGTRVIGERHRPTGTRASRAGPRPAVLAGPSRERRPRAGAGVDEAARQERDQRRVVGADGFVVGLADRTLVGGEAEPGDVLEDRGVEGLAGTLPVMVLDPEQDGGAGEPGAAPDPERIRDMSEMQEAGRSGRVPRPRRARDGDGHL